MFNTRNTLNLLQQIRDWEVKDFHDIKLFDFLAPAFIVSLASFLNSWLITKKRNFRWYLDTETYLDRCNFYEIIQRDKERNQFTWKSNNLLELTPIDEQDYNLSKSSEIAMKLFVKFKNIEKESEEWKIFLTNLENTIMLAMTEIIDNIGNHSWADLSQNASMYMLQHYPSTNITRLAVIDNGIGIINSLKNSSHYSEDKTDEDYLKLALQKGITNGKWMGNWLFMVSELVKETNSKLEICTGKYLYTQIWQEKIFEYTWIEFPWTLINIEFNMENIGIQKREWLQAMKHVNIEADDMDYYDNIFE